MAAKCNSELHWSMSLDSRTSVPAAGTASPAARPATRSGYAVAALNGWPRATSSTGSGLRRQAEQTRLHGDPRRASAPRPPPAARSPRGRPARAAGRRVRERPAAGVFDLTPTEDEQMLVDVVTELAAEVVRPAAAEADDACAAPADVLEATHRDRAADARGARGARRHRRGARGDGRHAGRRGAGARATWGSPSPASPPARSPPRSPPGAPTSSSRPTSRPSPATTSPRPRSR